MPYHKEKVYFGNIQSRMGRVVLVTKYVFFPGHQEPLAFLGSNLYCFLFFFPSFSNPSAHFCVLCSHEFDSEQIPDLTKDNYIHDIHSVSSLCKMYFRELPNPLLTYQLYEKFSVSTRLGLVA